MAVMRVKEPFDNVKSMTRLPPKGLTVKGIVHWNDLTRNEINKVLFFSEGQKCFVLGWRSQNSDETKYHLHISETFISTRCSLDSNIRFIKPPKAQQLCWFPTVEASLDILRRPKNLKKYSTKNLKKYSTKNLTLLSGIKI